MSVNTVSRVRRYNPDYIPLELKQFDKWVCWMPSVKTNGRVDKLPLDRYDFNRKVNSLTNCESWDQISRKTSANTSLGIGFYPDSVNTGLVGIDLDHVFTDQGQIRAESLEIVRMLDSYTELSPSRSGLHIWIQSQFSPDNRKSKALEIKSKGNCYLTVTGYCFGSVKPVFDRTKVFREILDKYFYRETPEERTDRLFLRIDDSDTLRKLWSKEERSKLWDGDISAYASADHPEGDRSSADLALCNYLYLCSNCDEEAVDRLFRRSRLMRPKWDEIHSADGRTYGQMTIAKVMERRK